LKCYASQLNVHFPYVDEIVGVLTQALHRKEFNCIDNDVQNFLSTRKLDLTILDVGLDDLLQLEFMLVCVAIMLPDMVIKLVLGGPNNSYKLEDGVAYLEIQRLLYAIYIFSLSCRDAIKFL